MLRGGHTHIGRGEVMRSWGLYGCSPIGCPGEFGEVTEDDPVWGPRNTTLASPSKRGIWGNPGGRPNTVRATQEPAEEIRWIRRYGKKTKTKSMCNNRPNPHYHYMTFLAWPQMFVLYCELVWYLAQRQPYELEIQHKQEPGYDFPISITSNKTKGTLQCIHFMSFTTSTWFECVTRVPFTWKKGKKVIM